MTRVVFYTFTGRSIAYDHERTGLRGEGQTLPGRWPELAINRDHGDVFDVIVELEPEGEEPRSWWWRVFGG